MLTANCDVLESKIKLKGKGYYYNGLYVHIFTEAVATGDTKMTTQYAVLCSEVLCKVNK